MDRDDAQDHREAEVGLGLFLDAIRSETINTDWPITTEQLVQLHGELVRTFEAWMRQHGRLP